MDLDAKHYKDNSSLQFCLATSVLHLHDFQGNEQILDVGCGDGKLTAQLAKCVPKGSIEGIDPSESMIELASSLFPDIQFTVGAAEKLFAIGKYDLVTAFSCLHWVRGQAEALRRMRDALKTHGHLLILTYPKASPYYRLLEEVVALDKYAAYAPLSACSHWLSPAEYSALAKELNLEKVRITTERKVAQYESAEALKDYVRGWLSCLIPLPLHLQEEFLEDLAKIAPLQIPYDTITLYLKRNEAP